MCQRAYWLVILLCLQGGLSLGQNVFWASEVIAFSAEASLVEYSSQQILGPPDVLPRQEISPNAWSPGNSRKEHSITVAFEEAIPIRQAAIAESYNVGSLKEVIALDPEGNKYLLFALNPGKNEQKGRMFNYFMTQTEYAVKALQLNFDGKLYDGQFYIDAVAISDSDIPIRAEVNELTLVRKDLNVEALGTQVNSDKNEIRPLLSPDGETLYFSRQYHEGNMAGSKDQEDIWVSQWDEALQDWSPATNMGAPLNTEGKNFVSAVSPNGSSTLLMLGNDYDRRKVRPGLSIASSNSSGWSEPVTIPFNSGVTISGEFDFDLSADRKVLVFAMRQADTYGEKDLYVSFLQRTGEWSEPINLGKVINTVGEEASPFLDSDGKTLYFSSNGYGGFGGHDIFAATRLDDSWTKWSKPENLGPDINSSDDEKYFNIPPNSNYAYMSRFTDRQKADIYRIEMPLFDEPTPVIAINIEVRDKRTGDLIKAQFSMENIIREGSQVNFSLEAGKIYQCLISAHGYFTHRQNIDLIQVKNADSTVNVVLTSIGEPMTFDRVNFARNQAMLLPQAFEDLDAIVTFLHENPKAWIEVASHTDNVGTDEDNMELSKLRAQAIFDYLTQSGNISPDRITMNWYGEARPIATIQTEEGRRQNRRVEFTIRQ